MSFIPLLLFDPSYYGVSMMSEQYRSQRRDPVKGPYGFSEVAAFLASVFYLT
jgi:hypothetical protein